MKITIGQLRRIIAEEVSSVAGDPLAKGAALAAELNAADNPEIARADMKRIDVPASELRVGDIDEDPVTGEFAALVRVTPRGARSVALDFGSGRSYVVRGDTMMSVIRLV